MAALIPLAEIAEWIEEIHQRPPGEPLTGGAPDLANDQGFVNVQAQQLAKRTQWLKENRPALATEAEVLAGQNATKAVSPALLAKALGKTGDGLPLHLDLSNEGQPTQNVAKNVPVRCNNMVDVGGNAGGLWNGHRYTVDADSLGVYGVFNRLNTNSETAEGAQTWVNGGVIASYQLDSGAGQGNIIPFTHFAILTTPGDYLEFYHNHGSSVSKSNDFSKAQIYRLMAYQPAV